jgi:hypothetical protein
MDDDVDRAKEYTLVRDPFGNLIAVSRNATIPIDGNPDIPSSVLQQVKNSIDGTETSVQTALTPYLTPHGSGVRVRVPKILD